MSKQIRLIILALLTIILSGALRVNAATLLVANLFEPTHSDGRIEIVNTDGTGRQLLREVGGGLRGVWFDPEAEHLYWSDVQADHIATVSINNLSGEPGAVVTDNLEFPKDLRMSQSPKKLFWSDTLRDEISVSEPDGSHRTQLFLGGDPGAIALDLVNRKVYVETRLTASRGSIIRFDYDGSNLETVVTDVPTANQIAIDPVHEYVFWTSSAGLSDGNGGVYRVDFDGTDFKEIFLKGANLDTGGLAVDSENGHVYWSQENAVNRTDIWRMGLDGSSPEMISSGYGNIAGMFIVSDFPDIPITVAIDIKPGNDRNIVNTKSKGGVWVAVLSDTDTGFDPLQIDMPTVRFGPDEAKALAHRVKDVNLDGVADLLLRFNIAETGISSGDTDGSLTAETHHGQAIRGTDAITTVGR